MNGLLQPCENTCEFPKVVGPSTITQRLLQRKDRLERELLQVNEALAALTANPDVEKILNLIAKANY